MAGFLTRTWRRFIQREMPTNSARTHVLRLLPARARALVDELESFASLAIDFCDYSGTSELHIDRNIVSTSVGHSSARIFLPDPSRPNPNAVVHELLHIKRYWVEKVPQMEAVNPANTTLTDDLDNCLEHLVIIPQQSRIGFDDTPYWNSVTSEYWSDFPWESDPHSFRAQALTGWLTATACDDDALIAGVKKRLAGVDLLDDAEILHSKLMCLHDSKPLMVATSLDALNIPRSAVRLVTLDVQNRCEAYSPVPIR